MNKQLIAALLAVPALFAANQACSNPWLNGTHVNGLPTPGPVLQGTRINGLPTPGPILQGTRINGLPTPGPILQGTQVDGLTAGPIVQAIQASAAPNWSALPASRLTVRLAAAI